MAVAVSVFIAFSWKKKGGRLSDSTFMFYMHSSAFLAIQGSFAG